MLNLYLAPRSGRAPTPTDESVERALGYLSEQGLIGAPGPEGHFPPGPSASWFFSTDAHETLLPAELTFEELRVVHAATPRFLPERQESEDFGRALCGSCGASVDPEALASELERLGYFPVERFSYVCPACRDTLALRQIDFGQPTALGRFWFYIEGAATGRLRPSVVEGLGRALDLPLVVVPEVVDAEAAAWAPPVSRRGRRR